MDPANSGVEGLHWVRYGIAGDQKYLLDPFDGTYDQLVVNANMVVNMPSAMSNFLSQQARKPFVIDPQTHVFQHEVDNLLSTSKRSEGMLKRSWERLINKYGEPLSSLFLSPNASSLSPEDLQDDILLGEFCERVLTFQKDEITREIEEGPDKEYLQFLAEETGEDLAKYPPSMLVAPYFYLSGSLLDDWLQLNARCLAASRELLCAKRLDIPLAAQLVLAKDVLADDQLLSEIVRTLRGCSPDIFLIWLDDFAEQAASRQQLTDFISFVETLGEGGTPVVNLYGGFFSVAQARAGRLRGKLQGVCHGLEYGESKPVIPVSGGVPVAKFYLRQLHHRLPTRVAYRAINELGGFASSAAFREVVCECCTCDELIVSEPIEEFRRYARTKPYSFWRSGRRVTLEFPTAEAADNCTRHYMWRKQREYCDALEANELTAQLSEAYQRLHRALGADYSGHARVWADFF